jgi:hypothetical protein
METGEGDGGSRQEHDGRVAPQSGFRERRTLLERLGTPRADLGSPAVTTGGRAVHQPGRHRSRSHGGWPTGPQPTSDVSGAAAAAAGAAGAVVAPATQPRDGGHAGKVGGKKKKTRRMPRNKHKKANSIPYSEMPWLERKRLQEEDEARLLRRVVAAGAATVPEESTANKGGRGRRGREPLHNNGKRPREQPPPAPSNTMARRARVVGMPSAPHTPAVASPSDDNRDGAAEQAGGADFFKETFENAMLTLYDDMRAWDVPALIAAIQGRDDIVDSLSVELNEYRDAGGVTSSATVAELQALRGQVADQAETIDELQAKLEVQTNKVQELERTFHEERSVLDVEAAEAHAFAED